MNLYRIVRPLLFKLSAETAHNAVYKLLCWISGTPIVSLLQRHYSVDDERLEVEEFGKKFRNPVGVAAGFDKKGKIIDSLIGFGFGHVEIGAVTLNPREGNPRPRLFRLEEDNAIINRMGFNNEGAEQIAQNLENQPLSDVPIGVNIGLTESTGLEDAPEEYAKTFEKLSAKGDYFVINISCPNLPKLRNLQQENHLIDVLDAFQDVEHSRVLIKLSPDMDEKELKDVVDILDNRNVDGIIATNTSDSRPPSLQSEEKTEEGGLSGEPIRQQSTDVIRFVAKHTDKPIIGVGGVSTAEDAYRKIRNGASLVQLYTGLVYKGPSIARNINQGLVELLEEDNFESVEEAVGADVSTETSSTEKKRAKSAADD